MIYFLTINYFSAELIGGLVESVASVADSPYHFVVVNNSVADRGLLDLHATTVTILETPENVGFGRACNVGLEWIASQDSAAIVWMINPDARLLPEVSLLALTEFIGQNKTIAILGTAIYTDTQDLWFGCGSFDPTTGAIEPRKRPHADRQSLHACNWVSGCSTILNLACFERYPQFDPAFFLYYEDFDFCQRYRQQGYVVAITDKFAVSHTPSSITNRNQFNKINHSTYSYLLVLKRYACPTARRWRFIRLVSHALLLLPFQPSVAFGKLYGVARYLSRSN